MRTTLVPVAPRNARRDTGRVVRAFIAAAVLVGAAPAAAQPLERSGTARAERLLVRGEAYLVAGDRSSAIGYFREAIQADPMNTGAYLALGEAYRGRGSFRDARTVLEAGLSRSSDHAPLWLSLVRTLVALDEPQDAALALRSLLARDPGHEEALRLRATLARDRGAWSEALTAYRALLWAEVPLTDEERSEALRFEAALRLLSRPMDPVSAARSCEGSPLRRALARCR